MARVVARAWALAGAAALLVAGAAVAALPTLYAATQDVPGGAYVGPDGPGEWRGGPRLSSPNGRARDPEAAARLWEVSEELTGVTYPV